MSTPSPQLLALQATLREGLALSGQGSYERRLPSKHALPKLRDARKGLRTLVEQESTPDAWRALALAEESLLNYPAASGALEKALALSPQPDRKDLKRLVHLKEAALKWERLGLTPQSLQELGRHLEDALRNAPCDHSHRHTTAWLVSHSVKATPSIKALKAAGGYCDCEVLLNVV